MGGNGSTARNVSFGLDENEKVTVIEGVKRQRSTALIFFSFSFERQQALVQEQLAKLAQMEREAAAVTDLSELTPALMLEKHKTHEEHEKAKLLVRDVVWLWKRLEQKEQELATISNFYKEKLDVLEKKVSVFPMKLARMTRPTAPVCSELQAKVLQCYRENPQQTLHCSSLANQYMTCVQQAKKVGVGPACGCWSIRKEKKSLVFFF
uniref:Coiled-coil-helix-coiled-coil-helix domain containing 6b n=1 Tax=Nothobranchius furzeri TaxID=105023 RepID=A0A8C6M237_NOTFU